MPTPPLTDVELRVLGSLIEKEITTPDAYPLSLAALTTACNQTSNRDPIVRLEEGAVTDATVSLRRRGLLLAIQPSGSRVTKFKHLAARELELDAQELAVMCVLMLRGPQTPGELRARTDRLAEFAGIAEIERTLDLLAARAPEPLVMRLPRRPGQKEARYAQLLSGEPAAEAHDAAGMADASAAWEPPAPRGGGDDERVAALERAVEQLRAELATLRAQLDDFRAQFQ